MLELFIASSIMKGIVGVTLFSLYTIPGIIWALIEMKREERTRQRFIRQGGISTNI